MGARFEAWKSKTVTCGKKSKVSRKQEKAIMKALTSLETELKDFPETLREVFEKVGLDPEVGRTGVDSMLSCIFFNPEEAGKAVHLLGYFFLAMGSKIRKQQEQK